MTIENITCGFIGLGLIGGSIAKALRERIANVQIYAYDKNISSLVSAKKEGIIDEYYDQIEQHFANCDYIFLCATVEKNNENLIAIKGNISPNCILTDVGSVKTSIHETVTELAFDKQFIGGHPMAGSERTGYQSARASLLENIYYILTPTEKTEPTLLENYKKLVTLLGAIPLVLDYRKHDYITAAISHLPHVIAASLVNLIESSDSNDGTMKMIAAGGFKDITRIASSSATMWQQICLSNTDNISMLLEEYIQTLVHFKTKLDHQDSETLYSLFDNARVYRDSFISASSGPIKCSYTITIDIADETGAIATIATILALNNISIKNIGITHNRELEEGALRIEFYEEKGMTTARGILSGKGYRIYEKKL